MGTTLLTAAKAKEITKNHNNLDDLLERIFYTAFKGESSFIVINDIPLLFRNSSRNFSLVLFSIRS